MNVKNKLQDCEQANEILREQLSQAYERIESMSNSEKMTTLCKIALGDLEKRYIKLEKKYNTLKKDRMGT